MIALDHATVGIRVNGKIMQGTRSGRRAIQTRIVTEVDDVERDHELGCFTDRAASEARNAGYGDKFPPHHAMDTTTPCGCEA